MKIFWTITALLFFGASVSGQDDTAIRYGKGKAELTIAQVSDKTLEIKLSPLGDDGKPAVSPPSDVLIEYPHTLIWQGTAVEGGEVIRKAGELTVRIRQSPLSVSIEN